MSLTVTHKDLVQVMKQWWNANVYSPLEDVTDSLLTCSDVLTQKFRSLEDKYLVLLAIPDFLIKQDARLIFFPCQRPSLAYLDADEVHSAVFGHSSGQQGLPCTRSAVQQYSWAMADRKIGEQDGILQHNRELPPVMKHLHFFNLRLASHFKRIKKMKYIIFMFQKELV